MTTQVQAVLFDYSGTLFRLEEDESWFEGIKVDEREVDGHVQAELMRRLTAPAGRSVEMTPEAYHAWVNRDLAPHLHREAYLHVLRESGLADHHAEALYDRVIDTSSWTPYPDTAEVLKGLHRQGIKTAVVSNIAFDVRPAFEAIGAADYVDEFVLSFEVGAIKPDAAIFETALARLGVEAAHAVMVGDSDEADGGARAVGCGFILVDPLPTVERRDGLKTALTDFGVEATSSHVRPDPRAMVAEAGERRLHGAAAAWHAISGKERSVVLTAPGRKSGSPVRRRSLRWMSTGSATSSRRFPGADWVANVRAADAVTLTEGRRTERVRMVGVSPGAGRPVLRCVPGEQVPAGVGFLKRSGLVTDGTPDELASLAGRLPVFRIDPIT